jgi:hypothetical protein
VAERVVCFAQKQGYGVTEALALKTNLTELGEGDAPLGPEDP